MEQQLAILRNFRVKIIEMFEYIWNDSQCFEQLDVVKEAHGNKDL